MSREINIGTSVYIYDSTMVAKTQYRKAIFEPGIPKFTSLSGVCCKFDASLNFNHYWLFLVNVYLRVIMLKAFQDEILRVIHWPCKAHAYLNPSMNNYDAEFRKPLNFMLCLNCKHWPWEKLNSFQSIQYHTR